MSAHDSNVNVLVGLVLTEALREEPRLENGRWVGEHRLVLRTVDRSFLFYHSQDCCETVKIHDIKGDLSDLVGAHLVEAAESVVRDADGLDGWPADVDISEYYPDSWTWTTLTFATSKGRVVVRWLGQSNGYYGESVSFVETTKGAPSW